MAAGKGSSFLLKDNSTGTPATIGGMRSTSMTINGEMVDITDKDANAFISSGNDKAIFNKIVRLIKESQVKWVIIAYNYKKQFLML